MSATLRQGQAGDAPDLRSYDHVVLFTSGGKDATACLLHLLEPVSYTHLTLPTILRV